MSKYTGLAKVVEKASKEEAQPDLFYSPPPDPAHTLYATIIIGQFLVILYLLISN